MKGVYENYFLITNEKLKITFINILAMTDNKKHRKDCGVFGFFSDEFQDA